MRRVVLGVVILLASPLAAASLLQLELGDHDFEWTSVEQDRARFGWWADVDNQTSRAFDVEVVLELLDEEDQLIHDDTVVVSVGPEATTRATHDGSMPFDRAADVASLRFRLNPRPPEEIGDIPHASVAARRGIEPIH